MKQEIIAVSVNLGEGGLCHESQESSNSRCGGSAVRGARIHNRSPGVSSLWCNVHGHRVKAIDDAIRLQLDKISHSTLLGLGQTCSIELAQRLIQIAPKELAKVFYSDSGATAVEIALKIAYQYWHNLGQKHRTRFIALRESYHGDTVGSVSVGGMELFHGIYKPLLFETFFAPTPHPYRFDGSAEQCTQASLAAMETLLEQNSGQIAGIIIEPCVQGAPGMLVHPKGYLKGVGQLARKYDVLLIADEVATGFGRTGKMFACEIEGVCPDFMCLAKGISAGYLPLAATLATQKIDIDRPGRVVPQTVHLVSQDGQDSIAGSFRNHHRS